MGTSRAIRGPVSFSNIYSSFLWFPKELMLQGSYLGVKRDEVLR